MFLGYISEAHCVSTYPALPRNARENRYTTKRKLTEYKTDMIEFITWKLAIKASANPW